MKKNKLRGKYYSKTDIGKVRITNEDQACSLINEKGNVLLCVCDGMGGHAKGDYASKIAIDLVRNSFKKTKGFYTRFGAQRFFSKTLKSIAKSIYDTGYKDPSCEGMGTTLVMAIITNKCIYIANVGDSRAYSVLSTGLKQLTDDQTMANYLVNTKQISKEESKTSEVRHVLTNSLGTTPSASFAFNVYVNIGNSILLCSDGLYNNIPESDICRILLTDEDISMKVDSLINVANSNGGSDNIGIAYWESLK